MALVPRITAIAAAVSSLSFFLSLAPLAMAALASRLAFRSRIAFFFKGRRREEEGSDEKGGGKEEQGTMLVAYTWPSNTRTYDTDSHETHRHYDRDNQWS